MSRRPTRRLGQLIDEAEVSSDLIRAADYEANLLGHPYVGLEHVQLARLRHAGAVSEPDRLHATLAGEVPHRWWQIRGRRSALRRAGRAQTDAARRAAEVRERNEPHG
jgi:hypothetical protein